MDKSINCNLVITIIIPTYNRKTTLVKCLRALFNQTLSEKKYEIIVVDDGSLDSTAKAVKSLQINSPCQIRYFKQENKGPAAARNLGIKNAQGRILLFFGDDIIATPNLIEHHYQWHKQYPEDYAAVLGYVTWSPGIHVTPFMHWLEDGGPQFAYGNFKGQVEVDISDYFYTANVSLKKAFLLENNCFFDERFPHAAVEDMDLGMRLKQLGMMLKYNKDALGYHHHYTSLGAACKRMIKVGEALEIWEEIKGVSQPNSHSIQSYAYRIIRSPELFTKFLVFHILAMYNEKRAIKGNIYQFLMGSYKRIGIQKYRWKKRLKAE